MRIKLFESHNQKSYFKINSEEWVSLMDGTKLPIEMKLINYLFNKTNHYWRKICISCNDVTFKFRGGRDIYDISVWRVDDDWYLVNLGNSNLWKCDQISGLIDFLDNFGVIIRENPIHNEEDEEDEWEEDEEDEWEEDEDWEG